MLIITLIKKFEAKTSQSICDLSQDKSDATINPNQIEDARSDENENLKTVVIENDPNKMTRKVLEACRLVFWHIFDLSLI